MFDRLSAPFPPEIVSWRIGSMSRDKTKARALAYIDARDVMNRLDEACGSDGWQCDYLPMPNGTTCCRIGIRVIRTTEQLSFTEWVWRANGAGNTDVEAEKGSYSDAFKRAAVLWGVGRYLYGIDSPWVKVNEWKQIADDELPRLRALLPGGQKPNGKTAARSEYSRLSLLLKQASTVDGLRDLWFSEQAAITKLPHDWQESLTREKDDIKALLTQRAAA